MKPMSGCALFGAAKMLAGVRDAVILQHSVTGCNWGTLNFHYAQHPYDISQASTVVYEENVIGGGEELLRKGLQNVIALYPQCRAVFVISGCVPNMIGDDIESVLAECATDKYLAHIAAPGYAGNMDDGIETALYKLGDLCKPCARTEKISVNIIGVAADDPYAANDIAFLRALFGGKLQINCSLHDCTVADIANLSAAHLNLLFGYGEKLAESLLAKYKQPYIKCAYPYGVEGIISFLRVLEDRLPLDFSDEIRELEKRAQELVRKTADYLVNLYALPAIIAGDKAHLEGMKNFVQNELGMEAAACLDANEGDMECLEKLIEEKNAVLLLGSSFEKGLAAKYNIPLVRYVYPVFDEVVLGGQSLLGISGTGILLEKIINGALQQEYKIDGIYSKLRACMVKKDA